MVCQHLAKLEEALLKANIKETYRRQAWSNNCREWVYFDIVLQTEWALFPVKKHSGSLSLEQTMNRNGEKYKHSFLKREMNEFKKSNTRLKQ